MVRERLAGRDSPDYDASDGNDKHEGGETSTRSEQDDRSTARDSTVTTNRPGSAGNPSEGDTQAHVSTDELFRVLRNHRRRLALRYLREEGGRSTLGELAEDIAADELDKSTRALSSDERKRVYINLYQCHLPKMDRAGVVDFDKNRGTIRLRDEAAPLFDYLALEESDADSTRGAALSTYLLVATLVTAVLVVAAVVGIPALRAIPSLWLPLSVSGVALAVSVCSYLNRHGEQ